MKTASGRSFAFCAMLLSSACGTNYKPSEASQAPSQGRDDAEIALIRTLKQAGYHAGTLTADRKAYKEIATGDSSFRLLYESDSETERWSCPYAGTPAPEVKHHANPADFGRHSLVLGGCAGGSGVKKRIVWIPSTTGKNADRFADALFVLAQREPIDPAQDPEFQKVVQQYRDAGGHLALGEEVRAHRIGAEAAVKEKRFEDAVNEYGEALKLAPSWPQGHFNRALILAELGAYGAATRGMKRYLLLEPGAENARQVQDKIYAWQAKFK